MLRYFVLFTFLFTTSAQASTIRVTIDAAPIWMDWFDMSLTDVSGTVTGSFDVNDDGDGLVELAEVSNVSFTGTGFGGTGRNFSVSVAEDVLNESVTPIGAGLSLGLISFVNPGGDFMALSWDPFYGFPAFVVAGFSDPTFALLETPEFLVTAEALSSVPLPASLSFLVTAMLWFGVLRRRQR